jgi:hypothetical protein
MSLQNVLLFLMMTLFAAPLSLAADDAAKESSTLVYELRTYTANPGKLADLHKRFRDHTMRLFEKHGMKNIGYWVPLDKPDTLVYIVAHKSREAARQSWAAFLSDPEWKQVAKESNKDGDLVKHVDRQYLTPTDYSPIK